MAVKITVPKKHSFIKVAASHFVSLRGRHSIGKALLKNGAAEKSCKEIAATTRSTEALILDWLNQADLLRIKRIGRQYSDLLDKRTNLISALIKSAR